MKKSLSCFLLALGGMAAAVLGQQADPAKVAQVASGALKEARASWWGFNAEDSTAALQAAINSKVPKLIVDKMQSPWIVGETLSLVSNQEIVFEEGAELLAMKGKFKGVTDALICIRRVSNVTLRGLGKGATLKMRKADYHTDEYEQAEWRHCLSILSSKKINVLNLNLMESGGDGIYLGMASAEPPTDILIKDVICDGHNRQGISVIAGVNVLIENTKLINTNGTAPQAGIDFEPNRSKEPIKNFVMRNCYSANNTGGGYMFYLPNMTTESGPLEVTLENCVSENEARAPFSLVLPSGVGKTMTGFVKVKNCRFENCAGGISLSGTSTKGPKITFENLLMKDICKSNVNNTPVIVSVRPTDEDVAGNIHFENVIIEDNLERPCFKFIDGGLCCGLDMISGKITSIVKGKATVTEFSSEWAKKTYPKRVFRDVDFYDMKDAKFEPLTPGAEIPGRDLPRLQPRGRGVFSIFANAGEDIKFTAYFGQLGRYKAKFAGISYKTPSGKVVKLPDIPFKERKDYTIAKAPETGFYEVTINAGGNWSSIKRCNRPVMVSAGMKQADLVSGTGEFFVYVPEGTKEFAIRFFGEGMEGLKATVFGPDGAQLWQKDNISGMEQYLEEGDLTLKGGIFKMRIEPPSALPTIEDYHIRIYGVPPFIGLAPQLLVKPVK